MISKFNTRIVGVALAVAAALFSTTPNTVQAAGATELEELIVTARRREENLMETPVSIAAFSADEIRARQLERINQIGQATPNVEFRENANAGSSNYAAVAYIRGVGQSDFIASVEPGVGIYIDEAYIGVMSGAVMNLLDVESIQILRGPQATLFGRNTIGGAILVNSVKPSSEFGGKAEVLAGTDEWFEARGSLNVPITDTLYTRFSAVARQRDGYIDFPNVPGSDGGGSDETYGIRGALRWVPTDSLTVDFSADYSSSQNDGNPTVLRSPIIDSHPANVNPDNPLGLTSAGEYNQVIAPFLNGAPGEFTTENQLLGDEPYTSLGSQHEKGELDLWGINLTVNWDFGWAALKSITYYRDMESSDGRDEDNSDLQPISFIRDRMDSDQFSQEFQLSGQAFNEKLDWTTGIYYFEDDTFNPNPVDFPFFDLVSGSIVEKTSAAVFGQATFAFTEKLSGTLGLRYTDEDKDFIVDDRIQYVTRIWGPAVGGPPIELFLPPPPEPGSFHIVPTGKTEADAEETDVYLNLAYQWTDGLLVYGSYSTGFKGGGFVQRVVPGAVVTAFKPEFADVYELGFKWQGLDETLRLTGAAFFNDYTDLQVTVERGIAPVTENAGDAEIKGFELEFSWLPTEGLLFSGGVGYLDAEYTKLDPTATIPITNELASTPEWQYALSGAYTLPVTVFAGSLNFRLDYSWTDEYFMEAANDRFLQQDSFNVLNGAITWTSQSEQWELALQGLNMTDEWYMTSPQSSFINSGYVAPTVARPAQYNVRATFRF